MAEEPKRFSDEVEQLLHDAGWYPGRRVDDSILEQWLAIKWTNEPGYSMMFPSTLRVLQEFGGLTFSQLKMGRTYPVRPFTIDPLTIEASLDHSWLYDQWWAGDYLYPLGTYQGDDTLAITPSGSVYSTSHGFFLHGTTFDQALSHLLLGIQPVEIEVPIVDSSFDYFGRVVKAVRKALAPDENGSAPTCP